MRGGRWRSFAVRRRNLFGLGLALGFLLLALFADFIASDRPIVLRKAGTLYLLANLIEYPGLRGFVPGDLRPGDWALWPPVRHGPYTIPPLAELEGLRSIAPTLAVATTSLPCSTSTRSIGAVPITSAASRIGTPPGRTMSPIAASRSEIPREGATFGSSPKPVTGAANAARRPMKIRVPVVP